MCLTGSLSHLPALAPEASHALLSPLGAHAAVDAQEERDGVGLLNHGEQGAALELRGANHKALEACSCG